MSKYYRCENCKTSCNYRITGLCFICNHEVIYTKKNIIAGKTVREIRSELGISLKPKKKTIIERLEAIKC